MCIVVQTMYQMALFVEPGYLGGQAPSYTLLSPFLVVTQEVLPSILPLENGIMFTASSILIAEQRSCR